MITIMGFIKVMLPLVALLVAMTTTRILGGVGADNQKPTRGDPLWDWDEKPNPADATVDKKGKDDTIYVNVLEECQMDLIQCRQNLADFHEKTLVGAMYDQTEAHDQVGSCKKEVKTCQEDLADCKLGCPSQVPVQPDDSVDSPCKLEQMFFRRFAKRFINLLITEYKEDDSSLEADVRVELSQYNWGKLQQFVQQKGKVKLVDAHDLMSDMLISAHHDNSTLGSSWLERATGMDSTNIKFYALLCALSVMVVMFESITHSSWWQQLCAVMFVLFIISVGWNWIYLYKKEFALKMSKMQKLELIMPANCKPDKMTWLDSMKEVVRRQMTLQDDPCDMYHESVLVDPIYEVPPTRAISHTISVMFLEPLKVLGKNVAGFHRELLKDLPYMAVIPTLLSVYLFPVLVVVLLCYCPRHGRVRRDDAAWDRVHMLENQLRERHAIDRRQERIEEFEDPRREAFMPLPAGNPVRDNRLLFDAPAGRHQHQARRDHPEEVVAAERPQVRSRRRQRGSSESDLLQHRPQRQPFLRDLGAQHAQSAPYHGDVSEGDDSSDDADKQRGQQRPRALHLEGLPSTSSQVIRSSRVASHEDLRSNTSDIQGKPIGCPNSEVDSLEGRSALREAAGAKGGAQFRNEGSQGQRLQREGQTEPKGDKSPEAALDQRGAARGTGLEEEVKLKKEEPKLVGSAQTVSAALTPASSTDSEPFLTSSALGCDSPSSVSVIEGDSSPASGGSVDGDSHLQSLGMSLSGSIDVIEPLGNLGGKGEQSEDGHESDEFEVLSREQCQTQNIEN